MIRGWIAAAIGLLVSVSAACSNSEPEGSGGHGGQASTTSTTGMGGGAGGGTTASSTGSASGVTCTDACAKVTELVQAYGCAKSDTDCSCAAECADELDAWMACTPKDSSECSCNAAGELSCGSTLCQAERKAFEACQYGG